MHPKLKLENILHKTKNFFDSSIRIWDCRITASKKSCFKSFSASKRDKATPYWAKPTDKKGHILVRKFAPTQKSKPSSCLFSKIRGVSRAEKRHFEWIKITYPISLWHPKPKALVNIKGKSEDPTILCWETAALEGLQFCLALQPKLNWKLKLRSAGVFTKEKPWNLEFIQEHYKWNGSQSHLLRV